MAGAQLHPEALAAVLAAAAKTPPPGTAPAGGQDTSAGGGTPSPGGGGSPQSGAANPGADPSQDPNAQGGDPNAQAVWAEFPATDPSQIEALAQQMQSTQDPQALVEMLSQFMAQSQSDQDKLSQMHEAMLSHLMELLQGPGDAQGQPVDQGQGQLPPAGPGVGGQGTGY